MTHPILLIVCLSFSLLLFIGIYRLIFIYDPTPMAVRFVAGICVVVLLAFGLCHMLSSRSDPKWEPCSKEPAPNPDIVTLVRFQGEWRERNGVMSEEVQLNRTIRNGDGILRLEGGRTLNFDEFMPKVGPRVPTTNALRVFYEEDIKFPVRATIVYRNKVQDEESMCLFDEKGVYSENLKISEDVWASLKADKGVRLRVKVYNSGGVQASLGGEKLLPFTSIGRETGTYLLDAGPALKKHFARVMDRSPAWVTLTLQVEQPDDTAGVFWARLEPTK